VKPHIRLCGLSLLVGSGCVAPVETKVEGCVREAPDDIIIKTITCTSEQIPGGEGVLGDWLIAAPTYRAVIRNPIASVTMSGLQGGSLIDAAPWGRADRLHEVFPLKNGHWLDTEEVHITESSLELFGISRPWPNQNSDGTTHSLDLQWQFSDSPPHIRISGHEDIWIHGKGPLTPYTDRWISPNLSIYLDSTDSEDLGGAVLHRDATTLTFRDNALPLTYDVDTETIVDGQSTGATSIEFWSNEALLDRLLLSKSTFTSPIPNGTTRVRAVGEDGALSNFAPPSQGMDLTLIAGRQVTIQVEWSQENRWPVGVLWTEETQQVRTILPSEGGLLTIPTTVDTIQIGEYPRLIPQIVTLADSTEDEVFTLSVKAPFIPANQKWIHLNGQSDRSKRWRGTSTQAMDALVSKGIEWAVMAPEYDIGTLEDVEEEHSSVLWRAGSQSPHPDGWSIMSWPWVEKTRLSGRGASPIATLGPMDALASITGGPGARRFTAATSEWFANPETLDGTANQNHPDYIWVEDVMRSENPIAHLEPWFTHLNAQRFIPPVGDANWVPVQDPLQWSGADIEAALLEGRGTASNGPLLHFEVNQVRPGGTVNIYRPFDFGRLTVSVRVDGAVPDRLWIVSDGVSKEVSAPTSLSETQTFRIPTPKQWIVAIAWSPERGPWAMTAPIWIEHDPSGQ